MKNKVCRLHMRMCALYYRRNLTALMWDGDWNGRIETLRGFLREAINWRKLSQTHDYERQNRLGRD